MKTKLRSTFICTNCNAEFSRWIGKCSSCETWNTIQEMNASQIKQIKNKQSYTKEHGLEIFSLNNIVESTLPPLTTGIKDLDQVLGGGLVPSSIILLAGEPGVGKSTLMLEIARHSKMKTFYFTGEESVQQVAGRAKRMNIENEFLFFSRETNLDHICACLRVEKPYIAIIDSIQTIYRPERGGASGNAGQLREAAMELLDLARVTGTSILLTGHITKDGAIAGPRLLEHMVDVVLYFDSDRSNHYRILRAVKNRFGPVGEVALFEMIQQGIKTVSSLPIMLSRMEISGAVHSLILGGSRPLPVEVQALVTRSAGPPKRMAEGLDNKRLILLAAVLEKFLRDLKLAECDIFANLVGGFSSDEPALDLALCMAIISSSLEKPISRHIACLGEVGLAGELRPVERLGLRVKELQGLGFQTIYIPKENNIDFETKNVKIHRLSHIKEVLANTF